MAPAYPIIFTYRDIIAGNGFFAGVQADGRALLCEEAEGFWMHGVSPGTIAGGGDDRADAFRAFKERYLSVLFDIAAEAPTFDAFAAEVRAFFDAACKETADAWDAARVEVRAGRVTTDLPRVENPRPPHIEVALIQAGNPEENKLDEIAEAA